MIEKGSFGERFEMITYRWLRGCYMNPYEAEQKVNRLIPFLTTARPTLQLCDAFRNPLFHVVLAYDDASKHDVIGMASLFYQHNLLHTVAEIHDVVVDPAYRGQGIGKKLVELLLADAAQYARMIDREVALSLTSKPKRVAANALYVKLGFALVARAEDPNNPDQTNLYRKIVHPRLNP